MFKNNLKVAWRNLVRERRFTLLNLLGLSTGLACTILICLWVMDEIGKDKFHINGNRIYQVMQNAEEGDGGIFTTEHTPDLLGASLLNEVPEVEDAVVVRYLYWDETPGILSYNENGLKAKEIYATQNFFNVFSFPLVQGDINTALENKTSVLLSDVMAMKLFHTTDIVGKTVEWSKGTSAPNGINGPYKVMGVFKIPEASSITFDVIFSHEMYFSTVTHDISWFSSDPSTYILLKEGVNPDKLNEKLRGFIKSKFKDKEQQKWAGSLFIQKFADKYLHNTYENGKPSGGRINYVRLFSIIALFILLIACINFMNLSTAKAFQRYKEVGIKKVVGASRAMLAWQYLGESMIMSFLSLGVASILVALLLPAFRQITGKPLSIQMDFTIVLSMIAITLMTGIVAGSYPALYLSKFKPAMVLKGKLNTSGGETWMRKGLIVFQFTISAILILAVLVVYQQMDLVQTKDLGYNRDNIIHFTNEGNIAEHEDTFIKEAKAIPNVINVTNMEGDLLGNLSGGGRISWPGKTEQIQFSGSYADFDFVETMGLQMQQGRSFDLDYPTDSSGVIFNETAVRMMHLEEPLGTPIEFFGRKKHIIGVVKDFNYDSMYNKVGPYFISYRNNTANIVMRIKAGHEKQTLADLSDLFKKYNPNLPFEYTFLADDLNTLYASEQRVTVLSKYFAGLAIIISCLGLFGLAAFTAQKRQKEIGVRKVVGASITGIATMLSYDFLKLVCLSAVIAFPVALWLLNSWLQGFAYHIQISPLVFIITIVLLIFMTLVTISFQSIKAAMANPVKSLRIE
ncbi:ABC transporter permease [Flagellimonas pelagia]|uniref:ABC transporter permease n=1 Tax=Flagellimonas pelagia TaxID=2306998 RepID=A0A3A1NGQ4_9FLAO|nr:ABC transporter permease [Allomuricauda maritima]RIV43875.1 ABC transporter permease [Allomuricauda maritima]TXJ93775.1 FtsX-like permease family protein [Allomuricauda maritima]